MRSDGCRGLGGKAWRRMMAWWVLCWLKVHKWLGKGLEFWVDEVIAYVGMLSCRCSSAQVDYIGKGSWSSDEDSLGAETKYASHQ
jgi:hypothetical protein